MDRFFSVVIEREDGRTETVPLTGQTPGAVYQQAKQLPGVRRVGKVAELNGAAAHATARAGAPASTNNRPAAAAAAPAPGRTERASGYDPKVGFVLTGPRVVVHARPSGGEQPFRHLQAPPEQYGPPKPQPPKPVVAAPQPVAPTQPVAAVTPAAPAAKAAAEARTVAPASPAEPKYRVMKSRRRDGLPFLLQRGTWRDAGGKRLFEAAWEKGFPTREQAEAHLAWIAQTERERAEVGDATASDADAEAEAAEDELAEMDCQAA